MNTTPKITHDELARDLAEYLRGMSKRITWEDMQLGPSGSPRPDVYAMEPTYTKLTFEAFECKVSVSDFRSDVTAGKWQSYLKYANAVTFAVPAGLIDKSAVPPTCGLIVRSAAGVWRYQKKPTRTVLADIPWQAWIKLLLDGVGRTGMSLKRAHWNQYMAERGLAKKFGDETAKMLADLQSLPERYRCAIERHETSLKVLDDRYRRAQEAKHIEAQAAVERCSQTVGRLAVTLGLPADAMVSDLQGRAAQLLRMLEARRGAYERHPMLEMADRMDRLAAELRQAGQALSGQGAAEQGGLHA